jgi:REP element-mobilizing transposase RayT
MAPPATAGGWQTAPPAIAGGSVILRHVLDDLPLAYLITFRSYGTWLHGDERGSVDRFHNQYGAAYFAPNDARLDQNRRRLKRAPVILSLEQRQSIEQAIRETCDVRRWLLRAVNVRTNHAHAVVATQVRPELALNAFKANATRQLRQAGQWLHSRSPWSDGGSKRYVWTELGVERAIDYVLNGQDGAVPELDPPKRQQSASRTTCGSGWRRWGCGCCMSWRSVMVRPKR